MRWGVKINFVMFEDVSTCKGIWDRPGHPENFEKYGEEIL